MCRGSVGRRVVKEEARILVYTIGHYYAVFSTYRRMFLEELLLVKLPVYNLKRILEQRLKTLNEITYLLPCSLNKYHSLLIPGFRVLEGGYELLARENYCRLVELLHTLLEKRGYIRPETIESIIDMVSTDYMVITHG